MAEEVSDISLACRQTGPIAFKEKMAQGDVMFSEKRSFFFKHMQIVRGCDAKRNTLVYMVYSDKFIDGSPKNSTSAVPIMPWGASADPAALRGVVRRVRRTGQESRRPAAHGARAAHPRSRDH